MAAGHSQWTTLKNQAGTGDPAALRKFEEFKRNRREYKQKHQADLDADAQRAITAANKKRESWAKWYRNKKAKVAAGDPEAVAWYEKRLATIKGCSERKKQNNRPSAVLDTDDDEIVASPRRRTSRPNLRSQPRPVCDEDSDNSTENIRYETLAESSRNIDQSPPPRQYRPPNKQDVTIPQKLVQQSLETALEPTKSRERTGAQPLSKGPNATDEPRVGLEGHHPSAFATNMTGEGNNANGNEQVGHGSAKPAPLAIQPIESTEHVEDMRGAVKASATALKRHKSQPKQVKHELIKQENPDVIIINDDAEVPTDDIEELELQWRQAEAEKRAVEAQLKLHRAKKARK